MPFTHTTANAVEKIAVRQKNFLASISKIKNLYTQTINMVEGLEFYSDAINGPITVIKSMAKFNELLISYKINGKEILEIRMLSEIIHGFKNKLYRLNAIPGIDAVINDPAEIIIVRMALPGLRDRVQENISALIVSTPDGQILLEHYTNYLKTIDALSKRLNA